MSAVCSRLPLSILPNMRGIWARKEFAQRINQRLPEDQTLYLVDFNGLTVAHLGDLDYVPTQQQIEILGAVDVALVPIGGGSGLNASQAAEVISLLEPSIVVPMHYRTPEITLKLDPLSKFLKEMGLSAPQPQESLKVTRPDLPEETHVVVLDYKRGA